MRITCLSIFVFALVVMTSCKKETPTKTTDPPSTPISQNNFTLKKEGALYSPNYIFVSQVDDDVLSVETYMVFQQPENNTYAIMIKRSIEPGTYLLEDGESEYFSIYHIQDANTYFGWEHGALTVLSNDTVQKVLHCNFEAKLFNDEIDQYPEVTDGEMTIIHFCFTNWFFL
jgi:hypothetical protein